MEEVIEVINNEYEHERKIMQKVKSKSPSYETATNDDPSLWSLVLLRNTRNAYLQLTDKYVLPDYPITDIKKEIILNYRHYLRNFINTNQEAILNGVEVVIDPIPII